MRLRVAGKTEKVENRFVRRKSYVVGRGRSGLGAILLAWLPPALDDCAALENVIAYESLMVTVIDSFLNVAVAEPGWEVTVAVKGPVGKIEW